MAPKELRRRIAEGVGVRQYKSGRVVYELQFTYLGISCREVLKGVPVTKANDKVAIARLGAVNDAIGRGTFRYAEFFPGSKRARLFGESFASATFKEYAAAWLTTVGPSYPHSTRRQYTRALERWAYPGIGALRLSDVKPAHLRELIQGSDIVAKTVRNYLTPVRLVFEQAVIDREIDRNPCDGIKVARLVSRERKSKYVVDPYSPTEIERLIHACAEHREEWAPYWLTAFFTGMRPSELYATAWPALADGVLHIEDAVVERERKETKTEASTRDLRLLPVAALAMEWQAEYTKAAGGEIFWNPRSGKPIRDYEESQRCLKFLCARADVRYRNQYQARHSFASNLLSQGENPLKVAAWMGHKDLEMLFRVYATWVEQGKEAAVAGSPITYGQITEPFTRYLRAQRLRIFK